LIRKYADLWGLTPQDTTVYLCGTRAWWKTEEAYCSGRMAEELDVEEIYFQPAKKSESEAAECEIRVRNSKRDASK